MWKLTKIVQFMATFRPITPPIPDSIPVLEIIPKLLSEREKFCRITLIFRDTVNAQYCLAFVSKWPVSSCTWEANQVVVWTYNLPQLWEDLKNFFGTGFGQNKGKEIYE